MHKEGGLNQLNSTSLITLLLLFHSTKPCNAFRHFVQDLIEEGKIKLDGHLNGRINCISSLQLNSSSSKVNVRLVIFLKYQHEFFFFKKRNPYCITCLARLHKCKTNLQASRLPITCPQTET